MSNKFFIIIIIFHLYSAKPLSSYMYGAAYLMLMPFFLQKSLSLTDMKSSPLLAQRDFIFYLQLFLAFGSQVWKISTNSSFEHKYTTHVLYVFESNKIAVYVLSDNKDRLCGLHKSTCTFSSFFFALVISL